MRLYATVLILASLLTVLAQVKNFSAEEEKLEKPQEIYNELIEQMASRRSHEMWGVRNERKLTEAGVDVDTGVDTNNKMDLDYFGIPVKKVEKKLGTIVKNDKPSQVSSTQQLQQSGAMQKGQFPYTSPGHTQGTSMIGSQQAKKKNEFEEPK